MIMLDQNPVLYDIFSATITSSQDPRIKQSRRCTFPRIVDIYSYHDPFSVPLLNQNISLRNDA